MRHRPFEELPQSEQEDFIDLCIKCGWLPTDVVVSFEEVMPSDGAVGAIERQIVIEAKSNGWRQYYAAGHGTSWLAEFEVDLRAEKFGEAPG